MRRFEDKIALVTGAASGLGRATALGLAAEGASAMLLDIDEPGLQITAERARSSGAKVAVLRCDVSDPQACRRAVDGAVSLFGGLDVLANVAGVARFCHARDVSVEEWSRHIGVNLNGPFFLYQAALPLLLERGGNIVNVASSAAFVGEAYLVPYATTKAALVHMTRSLAMEHMHDGIRINAIAPGGMDTPMAARTVMPEGVSIELIRRYVGLRGVSSPEDVAQLILYVASDQGKSIHGACLAIDGGITAG